jgi:hypothetical protein
MVHEISILLSRGAGSPAWHHSAAMRDITKVSPVSNLPWLMGTKARRAPHPPCTQDRRAAPSSRSRARPRCLLSCVCEVAGRAAPFPCTTSSEASRPVRTSSLGLLISRAASLQGVLDVEFSNMREIAGPCSTSSHCLTCPHVCHVAGAMASGETWSGIKGHIGHD